MKGARSNAPRRRTAKPSRPRTDYESLLAFQMRAAGLPEPVTQFRFAAPARQWRADFCWPKYKLLVEVDGGVYTLGRHTRGVGYENDCRKLNEAERLGYHVLRFSTGMVTNGEALDGIIKMFERLEGI